MLGGSAEADREIGPMGTCRSPRRPRHVHAIGRVPAPPTPHALPDPRGWTSTRSGWRAEAPGQRNQGVATSRRREPPIQMKIGLPRHPHPPAFPHKDTYRALWVVVLVNPLGHARYATRGEVRGQMGTEAYRRAKRPPLSATPPVKIPWSRLARGFRTFLAVLSLELKDPPTAYSGSGRSPTAVRRTAGDRRPTRHRLGWQKQVSHSN